MSQEMEAVLASKRQGSRPAASLRAAAAAMAALLAEMEKFRQYRIWWALNDPVAYVFLCRAERRGAIVPWTRA